MTDPDKSRLSEILSRQERATPGEWRARPPIKGWTDIVAASVGPVAQTIPPAQIACAKPVQGSEANAQFIAHAHQDIPWLTSKLQAAWDRIAWLESSLTQAEERGLERAAKWHDRNAEHFQALSEKRRSAEIHDEARTFRDLAHDHRNAAQSIRALIQERNTP